MAVTIELTELQASAVRIGLVMLIQDPHPMPKRWLDAAREVAEMLVDA